MADNLVNEVENLCNPSDSGEMLHILIDAVAKTTTCIGSQIGVNFLHHNVHKSDVTENTTIKCLLSQFLAELYGVEFLVKEKTLQMKSSTYNYENELQDKHQYGENMIENVLVSHTGQLIKGLGDDFQQKKMDTTMVKEELIKKHTNKEIANKQNENAEEYDIVNDSAQENTNHVINVEIRNEETGNEDMDMECDDKKNWQSHVTEKHGGHVLSADDGDNISDEEETMYIIGLEQSDCEDGMTDRPTGDQSPPKTFGGSATCEICNATFVWKRSLARHLKSKHMDQLSCQTSKDSKNVCTKTEYTNSLIKKLRLRVLSTHGKCDSLSSPGKPLYKQENCDAELNEKELMFSYLKLTEANKQQPEIIQKCDADKIKITDTEILTQNENNIQKEVAMKSQVSPVTYKKFACKLCNISFTWKKCLKRHCIHKHKDILRGNTSIEDMMDENSPLNSNTASSGSEENEIQEEKKKGSGENQRNKDKSNFRSETSMHLKTEKCDLCGLTFAWKAGLNQHKRRKHKIDVKKLLNCRCCAKGFSSFMERFYHEKDEHNYIPSEYDIFTDSNSGEVKCKCPVCYLSLRQKNIKSHIQHHYNVDITELKCDICNLVSRTKRKLKLHKQIHGEAKYACDICGKLFHVKHYVNEHKLTHQSQTEDCQVTEEKNEI